MANRVSTSEKRSPYETILGRLEIAMGAVVVGAGLLLLLSVYSGQGDAAATEWSSRIAWLAVAAGLLGLVIPGWALLRGKWWLQLLPAIYVVAMVILRNSSLLSR